VFDLDIFEYLVYFFNIEMSPVHDSVIGGKLVNLMENRLKNFVGNNCSISSNFYKLAQSFVKRM